MGKSVAIEDTIFSVFASPAFVAEHLKVYPNNFVGVLSEECLRIDIDTGSPSYSIRAAKGFFIAQIFIKAGTGTRRTSVISDILDHYFVGKSFKRTEGTLLFTNSTLSHYGVDKSNPGLHLSEYTINYSWSNN